jgi:hypothetical protein
MKTVRIVTNNPNFAYKGRSFHRADGLGNPVDHDVDDAIAEELLSLPDTPFREVVEGEVVVSHADRERIAAEDADRSARTVMVKHPEKTPEPEATKKTVKIETKPKAAAKADAATEETPKVDDTEGAVEV